MIFGVPIEVVTLSALLAFIVIGMIVGIAFDLHKIFSRHKWGGRPNNKENNKNDKSDH